MARSPKKKKKSTDAPLAAGSAPPSLAEVKDLIDAIGTTRADDLDDAPRAIVWVIGSDRPGILAAVTTLLFKNGVNILDVSQSVMRGMFAMILMGDISGLSVSFDALKVQLESLGRELSMVISAQRAAVFEQMHRL